MNKIYTVSLDGTILYDAFNDLFEAQNHLLAHIKDAVDINWIDDYTVSYIFENHLYYGKINIHNLH